jgi:hypothetical protein
VAEAWATGKKEMTPGRSMPSGSPSKWISILFFTKQNKTGCKSATLLEYSLEF